MGIIATVKIAQKIEHRAYLRINNIEESLNTNISYLVRGYTDRQAYLDSLNPEADNEGVIIFEKTYEMDKAKYDPTLALRKQCYVDLMPNFVDAEAVIEATKLYTETLNS